MPPHPRPAEERFWSRVDVRGEDDCWLWMGKLNTSGYGHFDDTRTKPRRWTRTHKFSWELRHGPVPQGMCVLHHCDVRYPVGDITYRRCCNPAHLWLGTQRQNTADRDAKGRTAKGQRQSMYTHPEFRQFGDDNPARRFPEKLHRGENNPASKLTAEQVREIRKRRASGETTRILSDEFGVSMEMIRMIVKRQWWQHVE